MKKYPNFEKLQSTIIKSHGAFFAYTQSQFDEKAVQGVKYTQASFGLIIPKNEKEAMVKAINELLATAREWELKTNGAKAIIWAALSNYEAQYSGVHQSVQHCEAYGITKEQVINEYRGFMNYCVENEMI